MSLCKTGQISNCCLPNALMTLTEYLEDYASEETRQLGHNVVARELESIPKENARKIASEQVEYIKKFREGKAEPGEDGRRKRVEI